MKVRFKRLCAEAVVPTKAHETDAGFDLTAVTVSEDRKRNIVTYGTGIAVEIPDGYVGLIFPRSSVYRHQLSLSNCVGVIDSGYRGEIKLMFRICQPHISRYSLGDRIGQLVLLQLPGVELEEADDLSGSDRGEGGFGSSGR
jgi:dUTP pyrophosphatase